MQVIFNYVIETDAINFTFSIRLYRDPQQVHQGQSFVTLDVHRHSVRHVDVPVDQKDADRAGPTEARPAGHKVVGSAGETACHHGQRHRLQGIVVPFISDHNKFTNVVVSNDRRSYN